jgi:choline kinase
MRLIVPAAGGGSRLRPLTDERPKALVPFLGRPLLDWTLTAARANGLNDIVLIGGYKPAGLDNYGVRVLHNPDWAATSMVSSLMIAEEWFGDEFVMSYGNVAYRPEVLRTLIASPAEIAVVVDMDWQPYWERRFDDPLWDAESLRMSPDGTIRSIGQTVNRIEDVQAQYIGLVLFRGRGVKALRRAWVRAKTDAAYRRPILGHRAAMAKLAMTDVLDELTTGDVPVKAVPIHGGWVEIDTPKDLAVGEERWTAGEGRPVTAEAAGDPEGGPAAGASPSAPAVAPTAGGLAGGSSYVTTALPTFHPRRRW